jgi:hypothetical protein
MVEAEKLTQRRKLKFNQDHHYDDEEQEENHQIKKVDLSVNAANRRLQQQPATEPKTPIFYKSRPSLLDYDSLVGAVSYQGKEVSFEGFINLGIIFLAASALVMVVDNLKDKGILVNLSLLRCMSGDVYRCLSLIMLIGIQALLVYITSRVAMLLFPKDQISTSTKDIKKLKKPTMLQFGAHLLLAFMYVLIQGGMFSLIVYLIFENKVSLIVSLLITMTMMSYCMKLHSYYVYVFKTYNPAHIEDASKVSFGEFVYFLMAPTLCFFRSYPRTDRIRLTFIVKQLSLITSTLGFAYLIVMQYIEPVIKDETDIPLKFVRICIPWFVTWLLISFAIFHSFLNLVAELTYFSDRAFFLDWWNADAMEFWRKWNIPVHHWLMRHVYFQSIRLNFRKPWAIFFTFLLSAIIHELCMCIAFRTLRFYFFVAMLVQVPCVYLSSYLSKYDSLKRWNNISMWLSLFTGQPLMLLLYFRNWYSSSKALCDSEFVSQNLNMFPSY